MHTTLEILFELPASQVCNIDGKRMAVFTSSGEAGNWNDPKTPQEWSLTAEVVDSLSKEDQNLLKYHVAAIYRSLEAIENIMR